MCGNIQAGLTDSYYSQCISTFNKASVLCRPLAAPLWFSSTVFVCHESQAIFYELVLNFIWLSRPAHAANPSTCNNCYFSCDGAPNGIFRESICVQKNLRRLEMRIYFFIRARPFSIFHHSQRLYDTSSAYGKLLTGPEWMPLVSRHLSRLYYEHKP